MKEQPLNTIEKCPFCDDDARLDIVLPGNMDQSESWYVGCTSCGAKGPLSDDGPEKAIEKWNTRIKENELRAKLKEVNSDLSVCQDGNLELLNAEHELKKEVYALAFHPRAAKLMRKQKPFLVVANDEPYYRQVYDLIRDHEMFLGTWTTSDQWRYEDALAAIKKDGGG